jgi:acetyl-CoA C-acetyltransferase
VHPVDPGGFMLRQIVERNGIRAAAAGDAADVGFGTIDVTGRPAGNLARSCWLVCGLPLAVPGVTIDRQAVPRSGPCISRRRRS